MTRRPAALLATLLAATALAAAKPVPPGDMPPSSAPDEASERWRSQAVAACVDDLHAVPGFSADDLESICGCASARYLEEHGAAALPAVERGRFQGVMEGQLLTCTARVRPELASDVVRRSPTAPQTAPPVPEPPRADSKPADEGDGSAPADAGGGDSGAGFRDWLSTLALPAWLTGASILWWIAIGIFVLGLLILKLRRRDPRNDLLGPPPHIRRGAPPRPPRRPDLPR